MDYFEFKKDFLQDVKTVAVSTGEGSCAAFVDKVATYLIDAEVIPNFDMSFYNGKKGTSKYRVDGYVYDEFDNTMNLIIADFDGNDYERKITNTLANRDFGELRIFLSAALTTNLYKEIEMSTPCADLIDLLRLNEKNIRKYRFFIFTDAEMSTMIKNVDIDDYNGITVEGQIWNIERIFRVCGSDNGRQSIEINFKEYCKDGISCIEASSAITDQYRSYLGVIPGEVLANIYDKYGSKLLEGNVRSFLSTKVAVNKKIRVTILNSPKMFFAYNNGISVTAKDVVIENTENGRFITFARDFQIINGGQTTASISNARYKDHADLTNIYVQMKLTAFDESSSTIEESDELIRNISRSSNNQNKVSDADFFASHPFHRRMEQISRALFAPASEGAQYETKWFYERARGQYLQEQLRLSPAKKKQFELQHPKNKVIKKTDLAKVQNTWLGYPQIVSKGAQTNFMAFADEIDKQWKINDKEFNERYFEVTASLILMFQYLENSIPRQPWYEGGYRANIIYYTIAHFRNLIRQQFPGFDLDLILIWNKQGIPKQVGTSLIALAELVLQRITDPSRIVVNVTQWCKRCECWEEIKKIKYPLPSSLKLCLIDDNDQKSARRYAKKEQNVINGIDAQSEVVKYPVDMWKRLEKYATDKWMVSEQQYSALTVVIRKTNKIPPNPYQSKILLSLLQKAIEDGFKCEL